MKFHPVAYRYERDSLSTDIELTNKCNLSCGFCPRDRMPATGFMRRETFHRIIDRIEESPVAYKAASCGTGDSLLHPELADFIAYSKARGIPYRITTSATLLTPARSAELLEAGLSEIHFSVTGIHGEYSRIYGFPFEKTLENILAFRELSGKTGHCDIRIIMVQTPGLLHALDQVLSFWKGVGFDRKDIFLLEEHNRSGSHTINTAPPRTESATALPGDVRCPAPFVSVFIGWDGKYYLCSHDWEKKVAFGDVFQHGFADVYRQKQGYMTGCETLCQSCSFHPANYLRDITSPVDHPPRQTYDNFIASTRHNHALVEALTADLDAYAITRQTP